MFETLYFDRKSILNNLGFWAKFLCILVIPSILVFIAQPVILLIFVVFALLIILIGKLNFQQILKNLRYSLILFLSISVFLSVAFTPGLLKARIIIGLLISLRFIIALTLGLIFSMITDPVQIPTSMIRIKIPHRFGVMLMVAYRMIPLIIEKITSIVEIQETRGVNFSFSFKRIPNLIKNILSLIIPIVFSTLETSVGLSDTLLARGYNPYSPTITVPPSHFEKWDIIMIFSSILLIFIVVITK
jgi:energy-coupling factor transport system permease protein